MISVLAIPSWAWFIAGGAAALVIVYVVIMGAFIFLGLKRLNGG